MPLLASLGEEIAHYVLGSLRRNAMITKDRAISRLVKRTKARESIEHLLIGYVQGGGSDKWTRLNDARQAIEQDDVTLENAILETMRTTKLTGRSLWLHLLYFRGFIAIHLAAGLTNKTFGTPGGEPIVSFMKGMQRMMGTGGNLYRDFSKHFSRYAMLLLDERARKRSDLKSICCRLFVEQWPKGESQQPLANLANRIFDLTAVSVSTLVAKHRAETDQGR